jgi:PPK2 family polyphosphate:nucleotide phosphotransferase
MPVTDFDPASLRDLAARHRVSDGKGFHLADHEPADTGRLGSAGKAEAKALMGGAVEWIGAAQARLYAQDRWALLLVFQGMDAAGKDGVIRRVMAEVDPLGLEAQSFKAPSEEERDHDFLWRHARRAPERGRIGIFNRSYYEEVTVVRVHPEFLAGQKVPRPLLAGDVWSARFEDIKSYERFLARNGTMVRKFFLNVSKEEQRRRFLERLEQPDKHWKFNPRDVVERGHWDAYQTAYDDAIRHTATKEAPWFVVPADHKWYARLIVAAAVVDALAEMDCQIPIEDEERLKEMEAAKRVLLDEAPA